MSAGPATASPRTRWRMFWLAVAVELVVCGWDTWAVIHAALFGVPHAGTTYPTMHDHHGTYDGTWSSVLWAHLPIVLGGLVVLAAMYPWGARRTARA